MNAAAIKESREQSWERRLTQLLAFKALHGHCDVPYAWKENYALSRWVVQQRDAYKAGQMSPAHRRRLKQAGFSLESAPLHSQPRWERRYAQFTAFKEKHGHLRVTLNNETDPPGPPGLESWQKTQRYKQSAGTLLPARKARLDAIGICWESPQGVSDIAQMHWDRLWTRQFVQLLAFKEQHGHCEVPIHWEENPALARWVSLQRRERNLGTLRQSRRDRLDAVGFIWKVDGFPDTVGWELRYAQFTTFVQQHGHQHVTLRNETAPGLMSWRDFQRRKWHEGTLDPERKARLDASGFVWQNPRRLAASKAEHELALWASRYAQLTAFHARHGHCRPGAAYCTAEAPGLNVWVHAQRKLWRAGRLLPARLEQLRALGWEAPCTMQVKWEQHLAELSAYVSAHRCIPVYGTRLRSWLTSQRIQWRLGRLRTDRQARLEALGVIWDPHSPLLSTGQAVPHLQGPIAKRWDLRLEQLRAFKDQHGHTRVPRSGASADSVLRNWSKNQHSQRRLGTLSAERVRRLDELGHV